MQLKKYELYNEQKVDRVINGAPNDKGEVVGGIGEDAPEELILAEYDKLGGYIRGKDGAKVKTGSFYDFKAKKPKEKPEVIYQFRVNGHNIEIAEGEELPMDVQAAQVAEVQVEEKKKTRKKK